MKKKKIIFKENKSNLLVQLSTEKIEKKKNLRVNRDFGGKEVVDLEFFLLFKL